MMRELKKLKKLKLTDSEKRELFSRIRQSIWKLPGDSDASLNYPIASPFYAYGFFSSAYMKTGVLSLIVILFGGITTYASLGALPGDVLYGVKVNVVEKVSGITALSPESRAKKETKGIEKRIEELEKLAEEGRLTEEHGRIIEAQIEERLESFDRSVQEIKEKEGDQEAKIPVEEELESKLEEHKEKIIQIKEEIEGSDETMLDSILERTTSEQEDTVSEKSGQLQEGSVDENVLPDTNSEEEKNGRNDGALEKGESETEKEGEGEKDDILDKASGEEDVAPLS